MIAATGVILASLGAAACDAGVGDENLSASEAAATSDESARTEAPSDRPQRLVLGPTGAGPLRLGMSAAEVAATRSARSAPGSPHDGWLRGCRLLDYVDAELGRTPGRLVDGVVSPRNGLGQLVATPWMITPDGIRLGSPVEDVRRLLGRPSIEPGDLVTVEASEAAVYRVGMESDRVASLSLELRRMGCVR